MKTKDSMIIGLVIGAVVPFLGYVLLDEINELVMKSWMNSSRGISEEFRWIISIGFNLIPFGMLNRMSKEMTARGLVFATVIFAVTIMAIYWQTFITK